MGRESCAYYKDLCYLDTADRCFNQLEFLLERNQQTVCCAITSCSVFSVLCFPCSFFCVIPFAVKQTRDFMDVLKKTIEFDSGCENLQRISQLIQDNQDNQNLKKVIQFYKKDYEQNLERPDPLFYFIKRFFTETSPDDLFFVMFLFYFSGEVQLGNATSDGATHLHYFARSLEYCSSGSVQAAIINLLIEDIITKSKNLAEVKVVNPSDIYSFKKNDTYRDILERYASRHLKSSTPPPVVRPFLPSP